MGLSGDREHIAIGMQGLSAAATTPLVRIHSECLTGDVFGSARCDCGMQLKQAVEMIGSEGGYILYLRQEGRGIGLYAKIDAYALQTQGCDTFEANRALGFPGDARDYRCAAEMLRALGVSRIRLLSNNPDKAAQLQSHHIEVVEQIPTGVFITPDNLAYLTDKARIARHTLRLNGVR